MKRLLSLIVAVVCFVAYLPAQEVVVHVADFGAKPDDGKDDLKKIRKAIKKAETLKASKLVFEAGVYDLFCGNVEVDNALVISHVDGLEMTGAVDAEGNPATTLLRHYEMGNDLKARNLLRVDQCRDFTLSNVVFDNYPRYMSSGEVTFNDGHNVVIKVFDGCSLVDGTLLYCANLWDLDSRNLKHTGSVSFGGGVTKKAAEYTVRVTNFEDRMALIRSKDIASKVEVGDGISWHFGWNGTQVDFWKCDNMRMENVRSHSAIGFHFQSSLCRNVSGHKVRIGREGEDLNCGSRDAWKLWLCMGDIHMDDIYMDGVRWDGQNVHGKHLFVVGTECTDKVYFTYNGMAIERIEPGDKIGMWKNDSTEVMMTVKRYELLPPNDKYKRLAYAVFEEPVPDFISPNTVCNPYSHTCRYVLENSEFENIAGNASLLRNDNSIVRNSSFRHIMYPAVQLGGDLDNESVTGRNLLVEGCEFIDCAWMARNGAKAPVAAAMHKFKNFINPYIYDMRVINNRFVDSDTGIHMIKVDGAIIKGNTFENCKQKVRLDNCLNVDSDVVE